MTDKTLAVPMKVDAFVLNTLVAEDTSEDNTNAKIAPITQPNYTFLRLEQNILQNDTLPHVDLHNTSPAARNSRVTDLGTGETRENRLGVYVHWMLPAFYRAGTAATESGTRESDREGLKEPSEEEVDKKATQFRPAPNRWLVIRHAHDLPKEKVTLPEYEAWVLESDRKWTIDELDRSVDLQVDVSPFVDTSEKDIDDQAEVFVGGKWPATKWEGESTDGNHASKRVPLTVLNSGNMFFPDFQPHNGNVFSMLDTFEYEDPAEPVDSAGKRPKHKLDSVKADYYVVGWHADETEDPFHMLVGHQVQREARMETYSMYFKASNNPDQKVWRELDTSAVTICHGAVYGVEWNLNSKPASAADASSQALNQAMPVAVGTTPIDALLAYVRSHQDGPNNDMKGVMESIMSIERHLIGYDDPVDGAQLAADLQHNYNYDASDGGARYHFTNPDGVSATPLTPPMLTDLGVLNREQMRVDGLQRSLARCRWKLFSLWWKYVWEGEENDQHEWYNTEASALKTKIQQLGAALRNSNQTIDWLRTSASLANTEKESFPPFLRQRDPTLLVGNIASGWPHDWTGQLPVRVNTAITTWDKTADAEKISKSVGIDRLPTTIQPATTALVQEFINLDPLKSPTPFDKDSTCLPLYHDSVDPAKPDVLRDQWNGTQPWFPLFLEWEVEYSHIQIDRWSLEPRLGKLCYGIKDGIEIANDFKDPAAQDRRRLYGRNLILPQPSLWLRSRISQLFQNLSEAQMDEILPKEKREHLFRHVDQLQFLTCPLAGLHNHLLTMAQGTHIKPTLRPAGGKLTAIPAAVREAAGFDEATLEAMGTETDLTPYAKLVNFYDFPVTPLKLATHGQFKFTKINIIDKFGQAIHAIDPRWRVGPPPPLYPCISEFYAPQALQNGWPNVVESPTDTKNQFTQMGLHITQWARINAEFVTRAEDKKGWVPLTDSSTNPIWGWLVINYAEYAIQIFLPDGTFYREVRLGGQQGASTSDKWLPFDRPQDEPLATQLDHLISKLSHHEYLKAFVNMINGSLQHAAVAPDAYSQFRNSVVGKPLALTHIGWSLELADDEFDNESTLEHKEQDIHLLPRQEGGKLKPQYHFPFQLGDKQRSYDGLVGYFNPTAQTTDDGNDLLLDDCYTYFGVSDEPSPPPPGDNPLRKIDPSNYPSLRAFYTDPLRSAEEFDEERSRRLSECVHGVIMDPFTAVHAYSGILPSKAIQLPSWTWQEALSRMTTFFHMGPMVLTTDVPEYAPQHVLDPSFYSDIQDPAADQTRAGKVGIPALPAADWNWLQPYSVPDPEHQGEEKTAFMALGLEYVDQRPRLEDPPYTAVEGYFQMKRPLRPDQEEQAEPSSP